MQFHFFDPEAEYAVTDRETLPHWAQAGALTFITWRTWDSLPQSVLTALLDQRTQWLAAHGIDPKATAWKEAVTRLPAAQRAIFRRFVAERWEAALDSCHGECVLRRPELAAIVGNSLQHFDGQRYTLIDFVVMPNHVHLLAAFVNEEEMLKQCESWKHYTATKINRTLQRHGRFWEVDGFDHLVRNLEQFNYLRSYIADNPRRANLEAGAYLHYSRPL